LFREFGTAALLSPVGQGEIREFGENQATDIHPSSLRKKQ
jgi:hypothetical protein